MYRLNAPRTIQDCPCSIRVPLFVDGRQRTGGLRQARSKKFTLCLSRAVAIVLLPSWFIPVFLMRVRSYPFVAPMARASRRVPRQFGATNWTRIRKTGMRTPLFVLEPANSRSSDQAAEQDFTGTVRPIRVSLVELALHATGRGAGGSPALPGQATRLPQEAPET